MRAASHFDRDGMRLRAAALALLALAGCVGGANQGSVCRTNEMPVAEATLGLFWRSPARAYLLNSLGLASSCAPGNFR